MTSNTSKIAATITPEQVTEEIQSANSTTTTALSLLREEEFLDKTVRVFGTPENPLFLARDVAEWIEHSQPSVMLKSIDDDEKVKVNNLHSENRTGGNGTWFLTENGLYEVLMLSRKPKARQFKIRIK